jgi:hypothetical protein
MTISKTESRAIGSGAGRFASDRVSGKFERAAGVNEAAHSLATRSWRSTNPHRGHLIAVDVTPLCMRMGLNCFQHHWRFVGRNRSSQGLSGAGSFSRV